MIIKRVWVWLEKYSQDRQRLNEFERLGARMDPKSDAERIFWEAAYPTLQTLGRLTPQESVAGYKSDFVFVTRRGRKFIIEIYGYEYHNSSPQMLYDTRRIRELQEFGYEPIVIMAADVFRDAKGCAEQISRIVRARHNERI